MMDGELPYIPYMAEEICYLKEIDEEMSKDTELGRQLRWYQNRIKEKLKKQK